MFRGSSQKTTTKVEPNAALMGVQDALFLKNIVKSIRLKVMLSIQASIDTRGGQ